MTAVAHSSPDELLARARDARERAYAPYSRFAVGAALETEDGAVFTGCNVENASYGLTMCAERAVVVAAVAAGHRRFRRLAISTGDRLATPPCGACRQVLAEFCQELDVYSETEGHRMLWRLSELLPASFLRDSVLESEGEGGSSHEERIDG